ncbi:MAG TPA: TetR family transcriptional regulator [Leifsonia sp.]|nr:TetR family transcriptional regulator [Leifsonia sp.]
MSSVEAEARRPKRGRPVDVDPDRVALIALRHFDEHGYEATTMDDIAAVAGVSRRTLFRYFPNKSALVWGGVEPVVERMRAELENASAAERTIDVVRRALTRAIQLPPDRLEATRRRLVLIAGDGSLMGYGLAQLRRNRDLLAGFIAAREGIDTGSLRAQVLADVLTSANFSALTWWAVNGTGDPGPVLDAALDDIARGL